MTVFEAIAKAELELMAELERSRIAEGFEYPSETTGKIFVDSINEAVWFELRTHGYLTFATLDYPERAASGEKVVIVDDEEEAMAFGDE